MPSPGMCILLLRYRLVEKKFFETLCVVPKKKLSELFDSKGMQLLAQYGTVVGIAIV